MTRLEQFERTWSEVRTLNYPPGKVARVLGVLTETDPHDSDKTWIGRLSTVRRSAMALGLVSERQWYALSHAAAFDVIHNWIKEESTMATKPSAITNPDLSPALKELCNRIKNLTFSDMMLLARVLDSGGGLSLGTAVMAKLLLDVAEGLETGRLS